MTTPPLESSGFCFHLSITALTILNWKDLLPHLFPLGKWLPRGSAHSIFDSILDSFTTLLSSPEKLSIRAWGCPKSAGLQERLSQAQVNTISFFLLPAISHVGKGERGKVEAGALHGFLFSSYSLPSMTGKL